jgi:hypothetical protein
MQLQPGGSIPGKEEKVREWESGRVEEWEEHAFEGFKGKMDARGNNYVHTSNPITRLINPTRLLGFQLTKNKK